MVTRSVDALDLVVRRPNCHLVFPMLKCTRTHAHTHIHMYTHTLPISHAHSHILTFSHSHSLTVSQSHSLTVSQSHSLTVSQSHSLTASQSHSHTVTQSHSHTVTRSHGHTFAHIRTHSHTFATHLHIHTFTYTSDGSCPPQLFVLELPAKMLAIRQTHVGAGMIPLTDNFGGKKSLCSQLSTVSTNAPMSCPESVTSVGSTVLVRVWSRLCFCQARTCTRLSRKATPTGFFVTKLCSSASMAWLMTRSSKTKIR